MKGDPKILEKRESVVNDKMIDTNLIGIWKPYSIIEFCVPYTCYRGMSVVIDKLYLY